jgi:homoserine/homoserine lactone efflux protein
MALGIAALVSVSAITPGPNNVAVMSAAARGGFAGALPAIAGIVLGSQAMLLVAVAGVGAALAEHPAMGLAISIGGCLYLCILGGRMFGTDAGRRGHPDDARADRGRSDMLGLFAFQFMNPKGWAMVLTAVTAAQAGGRSAIVIGYLVVTFALIPAVCLSLWSLSGAVLSAQLRRPRFRVWFDRAMGALLIASALAMLADAWRAYA